jgi:hypothetical protein
MGLIQDIKQMGAWHNGEYKSGLVYCDFKLNKIRGCYSEEQFDAAVYDYLMENEKWTIGKLMKKKDINTGKLIYNYQQAYNIEVSRLKRYYFYGKDDKIEAEYREPTLTIVCAAQGQGKTKQTTDLIYGYVKGNPYTKTKPRKVLILDPNGEYRQFKTIKPEHVVLFSAHKTVEVRRVIPFHDNGDVKSPSEIYEDLKIMLKDFRGGLLVIEDTSLLIGDSIKLDTIGKFWTTRHRNADIILHFQYLGKAGNPKLLSSTSYLRLHKTVDDIDRHENKFEDRFEIVKIAYNIISQDYERATIGQSPDKIVKPE